MGQQFVVENMAGAAGNIAAQAKAQPGKLSYAMDGSNIYAAVIGKQMFAVGQSPADGASSEATAEYLRSERERRGKIFKDLALPPL